MEKPRTIQELKDSILEDVLTIIHEKFANIMKYAITRSLSFDQKTGGHLTGMILHS